MFENTFDYIIFEGVVRSGQLCILSTQTHEAHSEPSANRMLPRENMARFFRLLRQPVEPSRDSKFMSIRLLTLSQHAPDESVRQVLR